MMQNDTKTMTIYPAIDIIDGQCVRLAQGDFAQKTVYDADPANVARRWQDAGAKWLHLVDLDGARAGCPRNDEAIEKIIAAVHIPVQVGGGNRTLAQVQARLAMGVSRVIIGTAALENPALARELLAAYGGRIAVGVDARNGKVAVSGWETLSGADAADFLRALQEMGAETVIYTDISRDGMMRGPNVPMYKEAAATGLAVIASGGVSTMDDLARLSETNVAGAIIGKALYTNAIDLREAVHLYG